MYLIAREEGDEGPGGWWLEKDKSIKYKPSRCSPKLVLGMMNYFSQNN
jgi:hypothetical protein